MIKGVVFDMDGVLVDSNRSWVELYKKVASQVGVSKNFSYDEITQNFGEKNEIVLEGLVGKDRLAQAVSILEATITSDEWIESLRATSNSLAVLDHLRQRGLKLALVSGNEERVVRRILTRLGMLSYFEILVCGDEVEHAKPDPEGLLKAIAGLGLSTSEVVYIGDASNDVKAARAAGVPVLVVLTGALNRRKAEALKPNGLMPDLRGLLALI